MTSIDAFDPHDATWLREPYAIYRRYRDAAPLHWGAPWTGAITVNRTGNARGTLYVFRHADCSTLLKDDRLGREYVMPERLRNKMPEAWRPWFDSVSHWLLFIDPPKHTRLRRLVSKAFTPRIVEQLGPRIEAISTTLLDAMALKGRTTGELEVVADFARLLPILVIAEMIGVPAQDRLLMQQWAAAFIPAMDARSLGNSHHVYTRAARATTEFACYLRALVLQRRREPQEDLLSALVRAEDGGDSLSEDELIGMCMFLLVAGHETTINLIGNGIYALLQDPVLFKWFCAHPEAAHNVADEVLRYDSPVQFAFRDAHEDLEYNGVFIARQSLVGFVLGSANRDERWCVDPDRFDVTRDNGRGYLSFGGGIHYCLGAPLARLEGAIAFRQWAERFPNARVIEDRVVRAPGIAFRGLAALPVKV